MEEESEPLSEYDVADIAREVAEEVVGAAIDDNEMVRDSIFVSIAEEVTGAWNDDISDIQARLAQLEYIVSNMDYFKADRHHAHN